MAWKVTSQMSVREEFAALATIEGANVRELCRRFGVSPKTGYKWISRYRELGLEGLSDQSRRPRSSPGWLGHRRFSVVCVPSTNLRCLGHTLSRTHSIGAGWPRHRFGYLGDAGTRGFER